MLIYKTIEYLLLSVQKLYILLYQFLKRGSNEAENICSKKRCEGSGGGSVGRAVDSDSRDPWF